MTARKSILFLSSMHSQLVGFCRRHFCLLWDSWSSWISMLVLIEGKLLLYVITRPWISVTAATTDNHFLCQVLLDICWQKIQYTLDSSWKCHSSDHLGLKTKQLSRHILTDYVVVLVPQICHIFMSQLNKKGPKCKTDTQGRQIIEKSELY